MCHKFLFLKKEKNEINCYTEILNYGHTEPRKKPAIDLRFNMAHHAFDASDILAR